VLAGCQGEPGDGPATGGGEARFSGGIAGMTRAAGSQWDAGDTIGISAVAGVKYVNKAYRTATGGLTGAFQPVGEADKIYYETEGSENFKAYYPYSSLLAADAPYITASTADQSRQKEFDFLYGEGSGSRNRPEVSLTFAHRMARLVLTIVPGEGTSLEEVKAASYTLSNLVEEGQFNAFSGEATATGAAVSDRTLAGTATDAGVTCDLILFPQQFGSGSELTFAATVGAQTLEAKIDFATVADNGGNRLAAGTQYNLTVRVKKTGVTIGDCSISNWGEKDMGDIDTGVPPFGNKTAAQAAVGDFYMSDGTLVDKDDELTAKQQAACIGVVCSTDRNRIGADVAIALIAKGVMTPHGLVMALTNASEGCYWGESGKDEPGIENMEQLNGMYKNVDGYRETQWIIDTYGSDETLLRDTYSTFYHASRYGTAASGTARYAAPANTTGWFVPAIGQWWDILTNLGGIDLSDYEMSRERCMSINGAAPTVIENLNKHFGKIEGATLFKTNVHYQSSSELYDVSHPPINICAVIFDVFNDLRFDFGVRDSKSMRVRCCLAF